jgi:hypothetical protein
VSVVSYLIGDERAFDRVGVPVSLDAPGQLPGQVQRQAVPRAGAASSDRDPEGLRDLRVGSLDGDCQLVGGHPGSTEVVATVLVSPEFLQRLQNGGFDPLLFPHRHAVTVTAHSVVVKPAARSTPTLTA